MTPFRKVIVHIATSADGYVARADGDLDWLTSRPAPEGFYGMNAFMRSIDTKVLGRKTYEDIGRPDKWPSVKQWPNVTQLSLALGERINNAHKFVVTRDHSHDELKWGEYEAPEKITGDNIEGQISNLKNSKGGDIVIFGSPTLVRTLTDAKLIDEFQILVRPVVVNVGEHLFDHLKDRKDLELIEVKPLKEGSLFVKYRLV